MRGRPVIVLEAEARLREIEVFQPACSIGRRRQHPWRLTAGNG